MRDIRFEKYAKHISKWITSATWIAISCFGLSTPAYGQLRFSWPDTTVEIARYTTVEECLAATARIRNRIVLEANRGIDMDTIPLNTPERVSNNPAPVIQFARQCAAQFAPKTYSLEDGWNLLLRLYWQSDQAEYTTMLATRRLALIAKDDSVQQAAVLDTLIDLYQTVYPHLLRTADSLLQVRLSLPQIGPANAQGFQLNANQLEYARINGDTTLALRAATRIRQLNSVLTREDRSNPAFNSDIRSLIYKALKYLTYPAGLDSLRRSTNAFVALQQANWEVTNGGYNPNASFPVGQQAAVLPVDYLWSNGSQPSIHPVGQNAATVRPQPGRVGLIVFYGHECYTGSSFGVPTGKRKFPCATSFAALKRLAQRFPELDITVATETHGYFSYLDPMGLAEEAEWLHKWHQGYHQLPGTLVVTKTPFWRLPDPDRRRIEEILPHVTSYAFGKKRDGRDWIVPTSAFLISPEGVIIHADGLATPWTKLSEQEYSDLIAVLLDPNREKQSYAQDASADTLAKEPVVSLKPSSQLGHKSIQDTSVSTSAQAAVSSDPVLTDVRLTQVLRVIKGALKDGGGDTVRLRKISRALVTSFLAQRKPLPGEDSGDPFEAVPEFMNALDREHLRSDEFANLLMRILIAYSIVEPERRSDLKPQHAKQVSSQSQAKLTPVEIEVVRKNYEALNALVKQLQPLLAN